MYIQNVVLGPYVFNVGLEYIHRCRLIFDTTDPRGCLYDHSDSYIDVEQVVYA